MPFRFKKSESPEKAVRRVGGERVEGALVWVEKAHRPAAIHNVRKEIKKLRGLLRLVRGEIGRDDYRKLVKPLRRAADHLAASRDARVICRALESLTGKSEERFPTIHKMLRKQWRSETRRLLKGKVLSSVKKNLKKFGQRMRKLELRSSGWMVVEPGLMETYARGREAFGLALREPSPENLHAWRKQVKTFWYQLQMTCPNPTPALRQLIDRLELLGEHLGLGHDLVLLEHALVGLSAGLAGEVVKAGKMIEERQKKLHKAALQLGGQLFTEEPASLCQRLEEHWHVWRGERMVCR